MAHADKMIEIAAWAKFITTTLTDDAIELKSEYPTIFSAIEICSTMNSLKYHIALACMTAHEAATGSQNNSSKLSRFLKRNKIDKEFVDLKKELYKYTMPVLTVGISCVADDLTDETKKLFLNTLCYKIGYLYFSSSEMAAAKLRIQKLSDKTKK